MNLATVVDALISTGATAEQIAAVVHVFQEEVDKAEEERKAKLRARVRRHREKRAVTLGNVTKRSVTDGNVTPSPKPPTQFLPPKKTPPTEGQKKGSEGKSAQIADDAGQRFWDAYPHKVGKGDALRVLPQVLKTGVTLEEILAGVERYKSSKPSDRPWCNPATFLRQRRWEDQPAEAGRPPPAAPGEDAAKWRAMWALGQVQRDTPADPARREDWKDLLGYWFATARWPCSGPDPNHPQCPIPSEAVQRYAEKFGWLAPKIRAEEAA